MTHHHHTAHFRGGFELPSENSPAWKNKANDELVKLMDIVGDAQARAMTECIEGTWKFIYDAIKELVYRWTPDEPETQPHISIDLTPKVISFMADEGTRGIVDKVIVGKSFAEQWTNNPEDYKRYYGANEVEIK